MMKNKQFLPFAQVAQIYNIPSEEFVTYAQTTSYFQSCGVPNFNIPKEAWTFWTEAIRNSKGISLFYILLSSKLIFEKTTSILKWETDLHSNFTDSQWHSAIQRNYEFTRNVTYWDVLQKIVYRWYLTPSRIAKFSPLGNNLCWRGYSRESTLYHALWKCSKIKCFWNSVFSDLFPTLVVVYKNWTLT